MITKASPRYWRLMIITVYPKRAVPNLGGDTILRSDGCTIRKIARSFRQETLPRTFLRTLAAASVFRSYRVTRVVCGCCLLTSRLVTYNIDGNGIVFSGLYAIRIDFINCFKSSLLIKSVFDSFDNNNYSLFKWNIYLLMLTLSHWGVNYFCDFF